VKKTIFQILFIAPFVGLYYLYRSYGAPTIYLVALYAWIIIGLIVHALFGKVDKKGEIYTGLLSIVWHSIIWPYVIYKRVASRRVKHRGS
jgi:hypothetical protein